MSLCYVRTFQGQIEATLHSTRVTKLVLLIRFNFTLKKDLVLFRFVNKNKKTVRKSVGKNETFRQLAAIYNQAQ